MISGDPFKRNFTGDFQADAVSFACLNYNGPATAETNGLPGYNCPDGVRAQVFFPSCWDGVNLDSPSHSSHVSFPESGAYNDGACPASHPVHLISIFFETIYQTGNYDSMWGEALNTTQPFVFAYGDPTGFGYHGDFINGWDVNVLQQAVDNCLDASGDMTVCPYFNFLPNAESAGCHIPSYIDEDVLGQVNPLPKLPGCNPIQKGPGYATNDYDLCVDQPIIELDTSYLTDMTSQGYKYVGCATDGSTRTLSGAYEANNNMTVEGCVEFCKASGYTYAGLEYASQCFCGNDMPAADAPVYGQTGNCVMPCAGNSTQICGGPNALSLYQECTGLLCVNDIMVPQGGIPIEP